MCPATPVVTDVQDHGDSVTEIRAERERRLRPALAALGLFPNVAR